MPWKKYGINGDLKFKNRTYSVVILLELDWLDVDDDSFLTVVPVAALVRGAAAVGGGGGAELDVEFEMMLIADKEFTVLAVDRVDSSGFFSLNPFCHVCRAERISGFEGLLLLLL